jgi:hypothetical protein
MVSNQGQNPDLIAKERKDIIQALALQGKKAADPFTNPSTQTGILLHRLDLFLTRLDEQVHMTPEFKEKTKIHTGMEVICDEKHKFPQKYIEKAKALLEKWQSENWGAPVATKRESATESESDPEVNGESVRKKRKKSQPSNGDKSNTRIAKLPSPDHPIWGEHGICHGLYRMTSVNGRKTPALNKRYNQRPANVFGHNNIKVGAWSPLQLAALFNGGHGKSQAGIYGTEEAGAYSVVVSGQYDDLDEDFGNSLYYSGSGSHENTDPKRPAESTSDTLSLHTSLETQRPVRVLRSSKGKSKWAPTEGLRYDGLYKVESVDYPINGKGGMYEQFKLVRLEDQSPIDKSRPSPRELHDFAKIGDPYW